MKNLTIKKILFLLTLVVFSTQAEAQDWKSVLNGVANAAGEKISGKLAEKMDTLMIVGSWSYSKPDVRLESDDVLSKVGRELSAKKTEERMVEVLEKLGINENTVFTFNRDSTYTMRTDKHTMEGTYSLNKKTREIILTSRLKVQFTAVIDQNILKPNTMSFRFKAEKLMSLAKHITGSLAQKSTNKSITLANNLLNKYDGLTLGFELKKQ